MNRIASTSSAALALALGLGVSRPAQATQPLETFMAAARTHSFDARESAVTSEQRDAEADAALGALLPSVTARGSYTRNQYQVALTLPTDPPKTAYIQKYNQWDASAQLDVPIVNVSNYHRYKSQRLLSQMSQEQRAATALDIDRNVTRAYFNFLGASALVHSAELSQKATEDNLKVVSARRDAGAATDMDRERASASVEGARQEVANAKLNADLAARQLETLSGLVPAAAEEFPADDLHAEAPIETWLNQSGQSPLAKAAKTSQLAAEQARKAAKSALYPTLAGSAQERISNVGGFAGQSTVYTLQLVAQIRLDYATIANSRAQALAAEASGIRSERTARSLQDVTYEAYRRVETGIVKSRAARSQAASAARASSLASERYAAGVATQLDVTQAQRDAFMADANRIGADADLASSRAQLRLSVGQAPTSSQATAPLTTAAAPAPSPSPEQPATPPRNP
ncbi:MAG: TolC family protein [Polyangiaceae bacterium]